MNNEQYLQDGDSWILAEEIPDIDFQFSHIWLSSLTPSCVPAMKKAAAIVSDEGGLTCHAAIVSRELRVPCVVGTKVATSVLKDGDEVEVDATNGVVRILSL